jgi:hypothetical protein
MLKLTVEMRDIGTGVGFPMGDIEIPAHHRFAIYKSEPCRSWLKNAVLADAATAVGSYRDPRDVAASLLRFYTARVEYKEQECDDVWSELAFPALVDALDWFSEWEQLEPYLTKYEMVHPTGWPRFLQGCGVQIGLDITPRESKWIYSALTIGKNAKRQQEMENWISPVTLLTKSHVSENRGRKGTFAKYLTPEQIDQVVDVAGDWMALHGYPLEVSK